MIEKPCDIFDESKVDDWWPIDPKKY